MIQRKNALKENNRTILRGRETKISWSAYFEVRGIYKFPLIVRLGIVGITSRDFYPICATRCRSFVRSYTYKKRYAVQCCTYVPTSYDKSLHIHKFWPCALINFFRFFFFLSLKFTQKSIR